MSDTKITTLAEAAADFYAGAAQWLPAMVADLSEKELLTRIAPGRSHIYYNVGHLAATSDIANVLNGSPSVVDQRYKDLFDDGKESRDDAAEYPPIAEVVAVLHKAIDNTVAAIRTLSDEQLNSPTDQNVPDFLATATRFSLINGFGQHIAYHIGQIVPIVKMLGKEPWPKPE